MTKNEGGLSRHEQQEYQQGYQSGQANQTWPAIYLEPAQPGQTLAAHGVAEPETAPREIVLPDSEPGQFVQASAADLQNLLMGQTSILQSSWVLSQVELRPQYKPEPNAMEAPISLSKSMLWNIQDAFFQNVGLNAYSLGQAVPASLGNTIYSAESYAEMILAFVDDHYDQLDLSEPLYIVELGAGTGRFSYLTLCEVLRKQSFIQKFRNVSFRYVMTDYVESNCQFWEAHEQLRPLVSAGLLDFARFDPLGSAPENPLYLRQAGKTLDTTANPVIVLANSLFESVRQDLFRVENGQLQEVNVQTTLKSHIPLNYAGMMLTLGDVELRYLPDVERQSLDQVSHYQDAVLDALLGQIAHDATGIGSFLFPVGALRAIQRLQSLNDKMLLISSDNALTDRHTALRPASHSSGAYPAFQMKGGALSYQVNYDVIGRYFEMQGGQSLSTGNPNWDLQTACWLTGSLNVRPSERLQYLFANKIQRVNPNNSLYNLSTQPKNEPVSLMGYWLAYLRLNMAEPAAFAGLEKHLLALVEYATPEQKDELILLMEAAWENFYRTPGEVNLPFVIAQLYHKMEMHEPCLEFIDKTMANFGEHEMLYCIKAFIYSQTHRTELARQNYQRALALKPDCELAQRKLGELDVA